MLTGCNADWQALRNLAAFLYERSVEDVREQARWKGSKGAQGTWRIKKD